VADARLYAFPSIPGADGSLDVTTFGEVFGALAVLLKGGKIEAVLVELEMLARDYAGVDIPVLPRDR
jgi:hypothetical protein